MKSLARGLSIALCLVAAACACPDVKVPASDATPPNISWTVTNNKTNAFADFTGNATVPARWGDDFSVRMVVNDPEGVGEISLAVTIEHSCSGQQVGPGLASPDVTTQSRDSNGRACTQLSKQVDLDFRLSCPGGGAFQSGTANLLAKGENFYGGVMSATLRFDITP